MSGERVFGRVDSMLRKAPNVSTDKIESKVMFQSNNTSQWLMKKDDSERKKAFEHDSCHGKLAKRGKDASRCLQINAKKNCRSSVHS